MKPSPAHPSRLRICTNCEDRFLPGARKSQTYVCDSCYRAYWRNVKRKARGVGKDRQAFLEAKYQLKPPANSGLLLCATCLEVLPENAFGRTYEPARKRGRRSACKACRRKQNADAR